MLYTARFAEQSPEGYRLTEAEKSEMNRQKDPHADVDKPGVDDKVQFQGRDWSLTRRQSHEKKDSGGSQQR